MVENKNTATVTGLLTEIIEDHSVLGEKFYTGQLKCTRLSGYDDMIPVTIPERLLGTKKVEEVLGPISVTGQVRSYNKTVDGASRLVLTLFAQDFKTPEPDDPQNHVVIEGTISRQPNFRITPFGREICDLMLAVPRRYGKSDYIPCIVWGRNGRWSSGLAVGSSVVITGRLQSREYEKLLDSGEVEKRMAYELSAFDISVATEEARALA